MTTTRTLVLFLVLLFVIGIAAGPAESASSHPAAGSPASGASAPAARIDDFEDRDLVAASGHSWVPLADDQFGGATRMTIAPLHPGASGSKGAMRLTATLGAGPMSVAGAWTPIVPGGRPADLSGLDGLRLSLRGHGDVLVGIRRGGGMGGVNFMSRVTATPEWQSFLVPFARLEAQGKQETPVSWDPHDGRWIGISSVPGAAGPFEVDVDDVTFTASNPAAKPASNPKDPAAFRNLPADDPAPLQKLAWRQLATDPDGDGKPGLPDARALFTAVDPQTHITWVRLDLRDDIPASWMGVNLILDTDGDPQDGAPWWGKNAAFKFDRLVTAWVFSATDHFEGMIGIAPPDQVAQGYVVSDDEVHLAIDRPARRVYLGVPSGILDDRTRAVAAVGSSFLFSDDLPDSGAVTLVPAPGIGK